MYRPAVAHWLRELSHDVFSIYEDARGLDDEATLQRAVSESRILITNDKDFGEMIFRDGNPHKGIILLRLEDERTTRKVEVLGQLIDRYSDQLAGNFVVVTERTVRITH